MSVVHCKKSTYDVYIGRPSIWGNPFVIGKDGTRDQVIDKYEQYLLSNEKLMSQIHKLKGKILGCFCRPAFKCHGDILVKYANQNESNESKLLQ